MDVVQFTIHGTTPLLLHSPASMRGDTKQTRKRIPTPEEEAEAGVYKFPDGSFCFPANGVRNSILSGTRGLRHQRRALQPFMAAVLLPSDPFFPILNGDGGPITHYAIDIQRAVVQRQGILRARPRIDLPWTIKCVFRYNKDIMMPAALEGYLAASLTQAGQIVGVGDYRVEKKGWYGCYVPGEIQVEVSE